MMQRFKLLIAVLFLIGGISLSAQDIHFSQFYASPLNLNPALTGVMNCNIRLTANYRNQWASVLRSDAYNTYAVSYDQKIAVGRYDYFGFGGAFWGDQAGSANFKTLTGKLSASYAKRMGGYRSRSSYLVAGVEAGYAQRSIDFLNLRWGLQHDGDGGWDPSAASGEEGVAWRDNLGFFDIGAGLLWFMVFDDKNNLFLGAAYHHLNRADVAFDEGEPDLLYSRFTFHGGGEFEISERFGIVPGAVVMFQGPSFQTNLGTGFKFKLGRDRFVKQAFHFGVWGRIANREGSGILADAIIPTARFDYQAFTFGFSYDINVSTLTPASNSQGAFEFSLQYQICNKLNRNVYCPDF